MNENRKSDLPLTGDADQPCVPVFNCIVYVTRTEQGVSARVANVDGIVFTASNERAALSKVVPAFKAMLAKCLESEEPIKWIDPVPELKDGGVPTFDPSAFVDSGPGLSVDRATQVRPNGGIHDACVSAGVQPLGAWNRSTASTDGLKPGHQRPRVQLRFTSCHPRC